MVMNTFGNCVLKAQDTACDIQPVYIFHRLALGNCRVREQNAEEGDTARNANVLLDGRVRGSLAKDSIESNLLITINNSKCYKLAQTSPLSYLTRQTSN